MILFRARNTRVAERWMQDVLVTLELDRVRVEAINFISGISDMNSFWRPALI